MYNAVYLDQNGMSHDGSEIILYCTTNVFQTTTLSEQSTVTKYITQCVRWRLNI